MTTDTAFQDLRKITAEDWRFIIQENMKKAELVATGHYHHPYTQKGIPSSVSQSGSGSLT